MRIYQDTDISIILERDGMEEILSKLNAIYDRLQKLDILPTRTNMEKLLQTLYDIREVFNQLKEAEKNDRTTADPERRDDH